MKYSALGESWAHQMATINGLPELADSVDVSTESTTYRCWLHARLSGDGDAQWQFSVICVGASWPWESELPQELCESRGGCHGFPSLISLRFLWTVKQHSTNGLETLVGPMGKVIPFMKWPWDVSEATEMKDSTHVATPLGPSGCDSAAILSHQSCRPFSITYSFEIRSAVPIKTKTNHLLATTTTTTKISFWSSVKTCY